MKAALREKYRKVLAAISRDEAARAATDATKQLVQLPEYQHAATVMLYLSFSHELATDAVVEDALGAGKTVLVPRVVDDNVMHAVPIHSPSADLVSGYRGIREPRDELPTFDCSLIEFVLVPGLAFDREGNRLGRGGGFYDRFLAGLPVRCVRCGFCFDAQVCEAVPTESHDELVNLIVTEQCVVHCGRS